MPPLSLAICLTPSFQPRMVTCSASFSTAISCTVTAGSSSTQMYPHLGQTTPFTNPPRHQQPTLIVAVTFWTPPPFSCLIAISLGKPSPYHLCSPPPLCGYLALLGYVLRHVCLFLLLKQQSSFIATASFHCYSNRPSLLLFFLLPPNLPSLQPLRQPVFNVASFSLSCPHCSNSLSNFIAGMSFVSHLHHGQCLLLHSFIEPIILHCWFVFATAAAAFIMDYFSCFLSSLRL